MKNGFEFLIKPDSVKNPRCSVVLVVMLSRGNVLHETQLCLDNLNINIRLLTLTQVFYCEVSTFFCMKAKVLFVCPPSWPARIAPPVQFNANRMS